MLQRSRRTETEPFNEASNNGLLFSRHTEPLGLFLPDSVNGVHDGDRMLVTVAGLYGDGGQLVSPSSGPACPAAVALSPGSEQGLAASMSSARARTSVLTKSSNRFGTGSRTDGLPTSQAKVLANETNTSDASSRRLLREGKGNGDQTVRRKGKVHRSF